MPITNVKARIMHIKPVKFAIRSLLFVDTKCLMFIIAAMDHSRYGSMSSYIRADQNRHLLLFLRRLLNLVFSC